MVKNLIVKMNFSLILSPNFITIKFKDLKDVGLMKIIWHKNVDVIIIIHAINISISQCDCRECAVHSENRTILLKL